MWEMALGAVIALVGVIIGSGIASVTHKKKDAEE